jgi:hypothetical protein
MVTGLEALPTWLIIVYIIAIVWTAIWKGIALWKSARLNHKIWFVLLLIINTLGILEILYIFIFSKCCRKKETRNLRKKRR